MSELIVCLFSQSVLPLVSVLTIVLATVAVHPSVELGQLAAAARSLNLNFNYLEPS